MIYILGHWLRGHYRFAHSEVVSCLGMARGLIENGADASVLWFAADGEVDGVPHVDALQARLGADDALIVLQPSIAEAVTVQPNLQHLLEAGQRWLYVGGYYGPAEPGASTFEVPWRKYQRLLVEREETVPFLRRQFPDMPADAVGFGASVPVGGDQEHENPFPRDCIPLFFAGRLTQPAVLRALMQALPPRFELWIAARTLCDADGGYHFVQAEHEAPQSWYTPREPVRGLSEAAAADMVRELVGRDRVHYLGALPFGTFAAHYRHAFATIDTGFQNEPCVNNYKTYDALSAGARVLAIGRSPTFGLIERYDGGAVVPWGAYEYAATVLCEWGYESETARVGRRAAFRSGEGWHRVARRILDVTHAE